MTSHTTSPETNELTQDSWSLLQCAARQLGKALLAVDLIERRAFADDSARTYGLLLERECPEPGSSYRAQLESGYQKAEDLFIATDREIMRRLRS